MAAGGVQLKATTSISCPRQNAHSPSPLSPHQVRDLLLVESVDGFCWSLTRPPCCSTALGGPSEDVVCLKAVSDEDRVLFAVEEVY